MAKTKALISFAVTAKLICVFVFAYAKSQFSHDAAHTIMILTFGTGSAGQTVQTSVRLLLEEHSDQRFHCLLFILHLLEALLHGKTFSKCFLECLQQGCLVSKNEGYQQYDRNGGGGTVK